MDRNEFIVQIISALEGREKESHESLMALKSKPQDIYRKLCYDFPSLTDAEISQLSDAVFTFSPCISKVAFLNPKFIENVLSLSFSSSNDEKSSDLCASLFLKLPYHFLNCNLSSLSIYLGNSNISYETEIPELDYNEILLPLTWDEIINRYRSLCLKSSVSLFTVSRTGNGFPTKYIDDILELMRFTGHVKGALTEQTSWGGPTDSWTLAQVLERAASESEVGSRRYGREAKEIWIHYTFLARDILLQHPAHLDQYLSDFLHALVPMEAVATRDVGKATGFPNDDQCLYALVLASVAVSLTNTHMATVGSHKTTKRSYSARVVSTITDCLVSVTDVLDRMVDYGSPKETIALICDVLGFYVLPPQGLSASAVGEVLVSSRLVAVALKAFVGATRPPGSTPALASNQHVAEVRRSVRVNISTLRICTCSNASYNYDDAHTNISFLF